MKARLMAGTGLAGMMAFSGGAVAGGVAPAWHLSGNMNFQAYFIDQDAVGLHSTGTPSFFFFTPTTLVTQVNVGGCRSMTGISASTRRSCSWRFRAAPTTA